MKKIILASIVSITAANASIIADGKGFSPIIIQVVQADSGTPIQGVKVRLEGAGEYKEVELDPSRQTKILPDSLGKPVETNAVGIAVVFCYGAWKDTSVDGKSSHSGKPLGTIIVEHDGKEIYRTTLEDWVKKNGYKKEANSAPWLVIPVIGSK